mmetsp:Transcript_1241/g.3027  ORF Transcript_1241/g.3027 Transcript_1241/m.3027 type:complete len:257 (+) Transcript_1241:115-885(+)
MDSEEPPQASAAETSPLLSPVAQVGSTSAATEEQTSYDPELAANGGPVAEKFAVGQVTVRLPLNWGILPMLALALSFLPWIFPFFLVMDILVTQRLLSIIALGLVGLCALISEVLLKPYFDSARPSTSACRKPDGTLLPGMPSGHVLNSQTLLVFYLSEVSYMMSEPWAPVVAVVLILLMPGVPWARWYNGDHTFNQVAVSAFLGTIIGTVALLGLHAFSTTHTHSTGPVSPSFLEQSIEKSWPILKSDSAFLSKH